MNYIEKKVIQLRYKGYTHGEIEKAIGGKFTKATIDTYFQFGGRLYFEYHRYCQEMDKLTTEDAIVELKKDASYAPKILRSILQKAIKKNNLDLAYRILCEQMDRAGLIVPKKLELKRGETREEMEKSLEELYAELERNNINPRTGIPYSLSEKSPTIAPAN